MKSKISYTGKKVSIGIDVHKKSFTISAVCEGELIKRLNTKPLGDEILKFIETRFHGAQVTTCYEAGFSGFWLHRYLESHGILNMVINASSVEISSRDRVKTDKRDSLKLALQLDSGRLKGIHIPSTERERMRLLSRTREQIVRSTCRIRNQIRMKLHQFGLIFFSDDRVLSREMVQDILSKGVSLDLEISINSLISVWEELSRQKKYLEKELFKQACLDETEEIWRSIPGIGLISSRILANELGDMSQFFNEKALFSYTGLTPSEYSSGDKIYKGHISRQGSARLRHVLVEASWRAIRKDLTLCRDFQRIAARRGKKRAIIAIARKLVGRARAVFRTKGSYELAYSKAA